MKFTFKWNCFLFSSDFVKIMKESLTFIISAEIDQHGHKMRERERERERERR